MIKSKYELQSRDGLVQSYQDMKTTVKTELNGKETIKKTSFIKPGLMTRILENMIVLYSLLHHLNTI
jgi:hypothetical protein